LFPGLVDETSGTEPDVLVRDGSESEISFFVDAASERVSVSDRDRLDFFRRAGSGVPAADVSEAASADGGGSSLRPFCEPAAESTVSETVLSSSGSMNSTFGRFAELGVLPPESAPSCVDGVDCVPFGDDEFDGDDAVVCPERPDSHASTFGRRSVTAMIAQRTIRRTMSLFRCWVDQGMRYLQ
jgi:hypothetical protein